MKTRLGNQAGQMIVEAVLIIALFFGFTMVIAAGFRSSGMYAKLVSGPWVVLAGMLQNGVWLPPEKGFSLHPSNHARHSSLDTN